MIFYDKLVENMQDRFGKNTEFMNATDCPRGDCTCHDTNPLNPWVVRCPICGCSNPKHDPTARANGGF